MKIINNIIKKIEELESDFELFNSRLIEFANTTSNSDIDPELLEKYINSLNNYKKLSIQYKNEINSWIKDDDLQEYKTQKELVIFRLDKLNKLFENNLSKLKLIYDSIKIKHNNKKNIDVDFNSRTEMLEINKNLYDFYNNYNKNLEYQKHYNINISLDNSFENDIEKKLCSLDLVKAENKYMIDLNNIFEKLELINNEFNNSFNRLSRYEDTTFVNLSTLHKFYFPKNSQNYVFRIFKEQLKNSYIIKNFDISINDLNKDFWKFKKIINSELKKIDFLINLYEFLWNYNLYKKLSKDYKFFTNLKIFDSLYEKINSLNKNSFSNISEIIIFINNHYYKENGKKYWYKIIIKKLDLFNITLSYLKKFDDIYKNKSNDLNYWFFTNLYSIISSNNTNTENYIKTWLNNIKLELNKKIINPRSENIKELSIWLQQINKLIINENTKLKSISKSIIILDNLIKNIKYNSWNSLLKYKKSASNIIKKIEQLFMIEPDSNIARIFKNYIYKNISLKYKSAEKEYYSDWYSSYWTWSDYSNSWSSYSSSSDSFSSSYSSSWSSNW